VTSSLFPPALFLFVQGFFHALKLMPLAFFLPSGAHSLLSVVTPPDSVSIFLPPDNGIDYSSTFSLFLVFLFGSLSSHPFSSRNTLAPPCPYHAVLSTQKTQPVSRTSFWRISPAKCAVRSFFSARPPKLSLIFPLSLGFVMGLFLPTFSFILRGLVHFNHSLFICSTALTLSLPSSPPQRRRSTPPFESFLAFLLRGGMFLCGPPDSWFPCPYSPDITVVLHGFP